MSIGKVKFVSHDEDEYVYLPKPMTMTYYQFCMFKNPYTKKYPTRKIVFNENGKILKVFEKEYSKDQIEIYIKHHRPNKYKMFPTGHLETIELPNSSDMSICQSQLINNDCKDYDYAPFSDILK